MPGIRGQHQGAALLGRGLLDLLHGLGIDGLLHALALPVQGAQLPGQTLCLAGIGAQQQVRRHIRRAHTAGGVDAGGQDKADLHGGHGLVGQARLPQQGVQTDEIRPADRCQPPGDDGPVLVGHLHHVGHGADGGQGAVPGQQGLLPALAPQGQHQLQRHAAPGQVLEGIAAVKPVGVHHRAGGRQLLLALMVVGDDHVHAQGVGIGHLLHAGDAAVHRYQQPDALVMQGQNGVLSQAVPILDAAGDIVHHVAAPGQEVIHQNHRGGDAVHVIVAEYGDPFPIGQGAVHPPGSPVHILHQKRGIGQLPVPLQEGSGLLRCGDAPGGQHGGHQIGVSGPGEPVHRLGRQVRYAPLLIFHDGTPLSRYCK